MRPEEELALFAEQVTKLTRLVADLRKQVLWLEKANNTQRDEMLRSHAELVALKKQYQDLQTAHALSSDNIEDKELARRKLNALISKIDQTVALLDAEPCSSTSEDAE